MRRPEVVDDDGLSLTDNLAPDPRLRQFVDLRGPLNVTLGHHAARPGVDLERLPLLVVAVDIAEPALGQRHRLIERRVQQLTRRLAGRLKDAHQAAQTCLTLQVRGIRPSSPGSDRGAGPQKRSDLSEDNVGSRIEEEIPIHRRIRICGEAVGNGLPIHQLRDGGVVQGRLIPDCPHHRGPLSVAHLRCHQDQSRLVLHSRS